MLGKNYNDTVPLGHILRERLFNDKWFSIHSLPSSKRYTDSEVPAIDCIFKNFNMPKEFCLYDSRYFYVDMMRREYRDLLIIFDKCKIEEYT